MIKHGDLTRIAKAAKCSVPMMCDIVHGRKRPSPELAKRLEDATGIDRQAWLYPREFKNPFIPRKKRTKVNA